MLDFSSLYATLPTIKPQIEMRLLVLRRTLKVPAGF